MFIKEKYIIRHKILGTLRLQAIPYDQTSELSVYDLQVTMKELSKTSKIPEFKIIEQIDYLLLLKEVECQWIDNEARYLLETKGQVAFYDNKYLDEGKRFRFEWFKERITLTSIIIAILISSITFISNLIDTHKNTKGIEDINTRIKSIENHLKTQNSLAQKVRNLNCY
jgi:hypothetical protein